MADIVLAAERIGAKGRNRYGICSRRGKSAYPGACNKMCDLATPPPPWGGGLSSIPGNCRYSGGGGGGGGDGGIFDGGGGLDGRYGGTLHLYPPEPPTLPHPPW